MRVGMKIQGFRDGFGRDLDARDYEGVVKDRSTPMSKDRASYRVSMRAGVRL